MPNKILWASDFDGTLYTGKRNQACIDKKTIKTIALWINQGGYFHILSASSMLGMARDNFDFIPTLFQELSNKCESKFHAESLIKEHVHFSMSNGIENYNIIAPHKTIEGGQVCLDKSVNTWVPRQKAVYFCKKIKKYGVSTLAMDHIVGTPNNISSIFIQQSVTNKNKYVFNVDSFIRTIERADSNFWVQFVRSTTLTSTTIRRFDIYPLLNGIKIDKGYIAEKIFPNYSSVIYTGDSEKGNDHTVFEYMKKHKNMKSFLVNGHEDVIKIIEKIVG